MKLYCLYDTVAEESGPIFESPTDAMARRIHQTMTGLPPGATIKDYRLYKLGYFNRGSYDKKPHVTAMSDGIDITNMHNKADLSRQVEMEEQISETV